MWKNKLAHCPTFLGTAILNNFLHQSIWVYLGLRGFLSKVSPDANISHPSHDMFFVVVVYSFHLDKQNDYLSQSSCL